MYVLFKYSQNAVRVSKYLSIVLSENLKQFFYNNIFKNAREKQIKQKNLLTKLYFSCCKSQMLNLIKFYQFSCFYLRRYNCNVSNITNLAPHINQIQVIQILQGWFLFVFCDCIPTTSRTYKKYFTGSSKDYLINLFYCLSSKVCHCNKYVVLFNKEKTSKGISGAFYYNLKYIIWDLTASNANVELTACFPRFDQKLS